MSDISIPSGPASYITVAEGGEAEIVEKKSRFIAHVMHVESEDEAVSFIEDIKKKYWDARHNCHAFSIGTVNPVTRCSDDGEPAQTAGKPILEVITGRQIRNVVIVVTRYFGGTLLGTGGLVRAYTAAAAAGLDASLIEERVRCVRFRLDMDYTLSGKVQYMASQMGYDIAETEYTDAVTMQILVPEGRVHEFEKKITELSSGRLIPQLLEICYKSNVI